jgi:serine/tyrosine/threonine adenylyltransferase
VAQWMALGFIHGVMNTDNTHVAGETIDYGPCAFMDAYHPDTVFSSIDDFGRYAYSSQPQVAVWYDLCANLAQFA